MINPKKRFEILKRDWFRCMYCGKTWKDVSLEVDHIIPKSKWWTDNLDNLITCCRECNLWKWNIEIEEKEWYRYFITELIKKKKKFFYDEWNKKWLWTINNKTAYLLSECIRLLLWWNNYYKFLPAPYYLWNYDISQYITCATKPIQFDMEKLDALFKTWWEFCKAVLEFVWYERISDEEILDIIDFCSDDDKRCWVQKNNLSLRLNYKLSELCWINELWDVYSVKKYSLFPNLLKND